MKNLGRNFSLLFALIITVSTYGQTEVSSELTSLIGMPLKEAHTVLLAKGYEIAQSSIFSSKQMWYNEDKNECGTFIFSKDDNHVIISIEPSKEKKCIRGVKASRRVWKSYINGAADMSSPQIDSEREKLKSQGCTASYWIKSPSPGKTAEIWHNKSTQLCKMLSWDTSTKSNVKVIDRDPRLGTNPAPVYDVN